MKIRRTLPDCPCNRCTNHRDMADRDYKVMLNATFGRGAWNMRGRHMILSGLAAFNRSTTVEE